MKSIIGLVLAFVVGFGCRAFGIPSPAPPVIVGALLVMVMTVGYLLVDRYMKRSAQHAINCGGPSGLTASDTPEGILPSTPLASRPSALAPLSARLGPLLVAMPEMRLIALLGLCAAYIQGGIVKVLDFGGAVAEAQHFGLPAATVVAGVTIITELGGSTLILTGVYRWVGAIRLAGFTLIATFVANRFWEIPQPDRFMVENAFFEHLGLVGGFLLVALYDLHERFNKVQLPAFLKKQQ